MSTEIEELRRMVGPIWAAFREIERIGLGAWHEDSEAGQAATRAAMLVVAQARVEALEPLTLVFASETITEYRRRVAVACAAAEALVTQLQAEVKA